MRILLTILLLAVLAIGTDAVLFNGSYTQAVWRTLSQYSVEIRGPSDPPAPPAENRPGPGNQPAPVAPAENRPNPG
jgi:hypothetical protein